MRMWIENVCLLNQTARFRIHVSGEAEIDSVEPLEGDAGDGLRPAFGHHPLAPPQEPTIDLMGDWLTLGGVDLQINGALGHAFPDLTVESLETLTKASLYLWEQGVDAYLPTIVTTAIPKIQTSLAAIATYCSGQGEMTAPKAKVLGAHLEGPFLNPEKRGAHPAEFLLPLTQERLQSVLGEYANSVAMMTLAPELNPSGEAIAWLHSQGIGVSLGHSLATASEAHQAFQQGATLLTHAFNAMPPLHHRAPGLLTAALLTSGVWIGVIADGVHVDPEMLTLLLRMRPTPGLFLVSDALAPLGLADGVYPWDSRQITVQAGTARLPDGTLSGTTLPLLTGVQNLVRWGCCEPERAIALATEAPRQALGLPGFGVGQPAENLLRWHWQADTKTLTWQRLQLP
jgi:N-acetylglucosamine-6-phosphate deacetylase